MRYLIGLAAGLGLVALGAPGTAWAASCAALETWAGKLSPQQVWILNSIDQRVRLYEIFRGTEFESLFGKPALAMTDGEIKAADAQLGQCAAEARKAKRNAELRALGAAQAEFTRRLQPLLQRVREAEAKLEPALAALESLTPSRPVLRSLDVLRRIATDADLRPGMGIPEGRQLVTLLAQLPQEAAVAAQPRVTALYGKVRQAVLAEADKAIADSPATLAGLGVLDQTVRGLKYEFGPALGPEDAAALDKAAASRREAIGAALVEEGGKALQSSPATLEGIGTLQQTAQRLKYELGRIASAEQMAMLDKAALDRRAAIELALVEQAKQAIDATPNGLDGLAPLQQLSYQPAMQALSQPNRDAVTAYIGQRRQATIAAAAAKAGEQPASLEGLAGLAQMLREPHAGTLAANERNQYMQAIVRRRAAIAEALLQEPIGKLDKAGGGLAGLKAMTAVRDEAYAKFGPHLAPQEFAPFERAYGASRQKAAASALPEFQARLAKVPEDDKGIAEIKAALAETGGGLAEFEQAAAQRTRAIQQKLASAMVKQVCDEAFKEAKLGRGDAAQPLLGVGGNVMTVGDFVCRLKIAEVKFNAYEGAGLFGKEHKLKLTNGQGTYLTYTLHEAEVAHGKKALVPFKVADANAEKALSVEEWQLHLAMLMPFDDANPPSPRECEALFGKPESQLSGFEQGQMFACIFAMATPAK